jgi:hypothetical protein
MKVATASDRSHGTPTEWEAVATPQFDGEMFTTVFGGLRGVYTWECDHLPSEEEVREGMCVRVARDCRRVRTRDRCTQLSEHGRRDQCHTTRPQSEMSPSSAITAPARRRWPRPSWPPPAPSPPGLGGKGHHDL